MVEIGRSEDGAWVVEVNGTLDLRSARELVELILARRRGEHVIIDFRHAREIHDAAIGQLANCLRHNPPPQVDLRCLCEHQARVFRYFGCSTHSPVADLHDALDVAPPEDPANTEHL
jgi:anti-anti-sigma regulatory factor